MTIQMFSLHSQTSLSKNPILGRSGKRLCKRCQALRLDEAVVHTPANKATFVARLANPHNVKDEKDCPLCCVFRTITSKQGPRGRTPSTRGYDLYMLPGSALCRPEFKRHGSSSDIGVAFGVFRRNNAKKVTLQDRTAAIAKGFIAPVNLDRKSFKVRLISQEQADFSTIRTWLYECQKGHPDNCKPQTFARREIPGFKCIDVETRKRVSIDSDASYYALSYVWREAHCANDSPQKHEADDLPLPQPGTPQLIEDAITIVKNLHGRYLWVDKYCNAQKDPQLLKQQLDTMNKVYEGAQATIVAAPTRTEHPAIIPSGIPGVSRPRVRSQPAAEVGDYVFAASLPHVSHVVEQSTWITRAWTYQEAVLSKRCLFFTDVQVYFTCPCMTACESIAVSPSQQKLMRKPQEVNSSGLKMLPRNRIGHAAPLRFFFENLQQYKSRDLTEAEDSLNAFSGILAKAPFINIWGVPIACSNQRGESYDEQTLCKGLARGIWWECPGGTAHDRLRPGEVQNPWHRYAEFPSWSWAGWRGPIRLHEDATSISSMIVECNQVEEESFEMDFKVQYTSGNVAPLADLISRSRLKEANEENPQQSLREDITLTHTLHIRTTVHLVGVRYGPDQNQANVCICTCPINSERCMGGHEFGPHRVRFFVDIHLAQDILGTTFPTYWGALPLFRCKSSMTSSIACLIIDWKEARGYETEVRGVAYLRDEVFSASHLKVIRLV